MHSTTMMTATTTAGAGERRAFDREVDILGRRAIGEHQVQELVQV